MVRRSIIKNQKGNPPHVVEMVAGRTTSSRGFEINTVKSG
jgi:hypothetical protein